MTNMAFLFPRNKQKVTLDLVRSAKELLLKLSNGEQLSSTVEDSLAQKLAQMKHILQGTPGM
jgi:calcium binding protein 39